MLGAVKLSKNTHSNKYSYSDYGIGFHSCSVFSIRNSDCGKNPITFGVDTSSSAHIDYILSLNLHFKESNSISFFNTTNIYQSKAKYSGLKQYPLCFKRFFRLL